MRTTPILLLGAAMLAACSTTDTDTAAADSAAMAAPAMAAAPDADAATQGGGLPAGYMGQVDLPRPGRDTAVLGQAEYTTQGQQWEVRTGPAHIVYAPGDTASGTYTASVVMDQMEQPSHPEAYGLIIGGRNLDQLANQRYTYFIVRHTGEYMVRVRDGAEARTVADWTASPAVPASGDDGKAHYAIAARVGADSVTFMVNDQPVTTVAKSAVPTDGIVGARINHNLHLMVTPVAVQR